KRRMTTRSSGTHSYFLPRHSLATSWCTTTSIHFEWKAGSANRLTLDALDAPRTIDIGDQYLFFEVTAILTAELDRISGASQ
ncbi:MAG: hypothetical protein ACXACH_07580, partial [Candidatus Hermodarchaeia archaeon]